jgi:hypothetical protein
MQSIGKTQGTLPKLTGGLGTHRLESKAAEEPRGMHRRLPAYGVGREGGRWGLTQIKIFVRYFAI